MLFFSNKMTYFTNRSDNLETKYLTERGEFGLIVLKLKNDEFGNFGKGPGIYLCCCNYSCYDNMVGKGGKAAVGGYWGEVVKEPCYVLPVTGTDEGMDDVMNE